MLIIVVTVKAFQMKEKHFNSKQTKTHTISLRF